MRMIFTCLLFCCFSGILEAQDMHRSNNIAKPAVDITTPGVSLDDVLTNRMPVCGLVENRVPHTKVIMRCAPAKIDNDPLYIINGVIAEIDDIKKINPSTIESINIVKAAAGTAIYCGTTRDVVLITTKSKQLNIKVTDADDQKVIAGATIRFIPVNSKRKVQVATAGPEGFINFKVQVKEYEIEITSVGYTTKRLIWNADSSRNKTITVAMEKQFVQMEPVAVIGYTSLLRRSVTCICGSVRVIQRTPLANYTKDNIVASTIFPNPLSRGQAATIQINAAKDELMQVRLFTFTGQQLLSFPAQVKQGSNRFTIPAENKLSAGMYMVQVLDHKGKPIQTDKLIIK